MPNVMDDVAALLSGQDPQAHPEGQEERQEEQETPPQLDGEGQAEEEQQAGDDSPKGQEEEQKPDGLDYTQPIPLGNGREATLGELKDYFQAAEQRELQAQEREAAIARQQVELDEMLYSVVDELPPQLRQIVAQRMSAQHARAAAAVLEAIPQWREETARQADFGLIQGLAEEYGLTAQIGHQLKFPSHPGTLQLLRDFARLRETVRKAGGKLKAAQAPQSRIKPGTVPRQDKGQALIQRAKQSGKQADQLAAVAQLLGST
jgi:hypothetical protein